MLYILLQHSADDNFGAGIGLVLTGAVIFVIFWLINKAQSRNVDGYIEVLATIVNIDRKNKSGNGANYYYSIVYKTKGGDSIQTKLDHSTIFKKFEVGQQIPIYYNPSEPKIHYSSEGRKQGKLFYIIQRGAAVVFGSIGVLILINVDYNYDMEIVKWFNQLKQKDNKELADESLIGECFENYIKQSVSNGLAITLEDCDSIVNSKSPKWQALSNKFCFQNFTENNIYFSYLNKDSTIDGIYTFYFTPCGNGKLNNHKGLSTFLILSKDNSYYIDDTFLNFPDLDSLGEFHIDSISNKTFYGYVNKTLKSNFSDQIKIEYPVQKVVFEK